MRRNPGFVAVAVLSLALGIGANVAVFAIVNQLLLSPLPVREPRELRQVVLSTVRRPYYQMPYTKYATLREQFPLFTTLFGWGAFGQIELTAGDRTTNGQLTLVTSNFFDGLGVRPGSSLRPSTACARNSSVNCRRGRRLPCAAIVDIVSTSRKLSTKPGQYRRRSRADHFILSDQLQRQRDVSR